MAENTNSGNCTKCTTTCMYVLVGLATFLLMAFLVRQMANATRPAPVGAERAVARAKDNAEIRAAGAQIAQSWGFANQPNGIVRLPVEEAMKMTVQGYKDAAAFRKDLLAREDKASAPPPKPKNEFE